MPRPPTNSARMAATMRFLPLGVEVPSALAVATPCLPPQCGQVTAVGEINAPQSRQCTALRMVGLVSTNIPPKLRVRRVCCFAVRNANGFRAEIIRFAVFHIHFG